MRKLVIVLLVFNAACSSVPKYEHMRSMDDAVNEFDQDHIKAGMAITKKGAVVDIKVEEVQEQKKQLLVQIAEKDQEIKSLKERLEENNGKYKELRLFVGLPIGEPKPGGECCDAEGNIKNFKAAPSLHEELAQLPRK